MNGQLSPTPAQTSQLFQKLLRVLNLTEERELTCAEVYALMDYVVELEAAGEKIQGLMPKIAQHLRICPDCEEELQALRHMLRSASNQ